MHCLWSEGTKSGQSQPPLAPDGLWVLETVWCSHQHPPLPRHTTDFTYTSTWQHTFSISKHPLPSSCGNGEKGRGQQGICSYSPAHRRRTAFGVPVWCGVSCHTGVPKLSQSGRHRSPPSGVARRVGVSRRGRWNGGGKALSRDPAMLFLIRLCISPSEKGFCLQVSMRHNPTGSIWQFHCLWNLLEVMAGRQ